MNAKQIEQFNLELDQLLGVVPGQPSTDSPMLQAASLLEQIDLDSELQPSVTLAARWAQQTDPQRRNRKKMNSQIRLLTAIALVLIVLVITFGSFPGVALALQRIFGYIPGVGVVDQSVTPRELAAPVSQTRDGVTVTVEKVTISEMVTAIHLKIAGIPASAYPLKTDEMSCGQSLYLRYPDGSTSKIAGFNGGSYGSKEYPDYEFDWTVTPIPARFDTAWLVLPCLINTQKGAAPENWELPLRFVPISPREIIPVIEIPTTLPTQPSTASPTPTVAATVPAQFAPHPEEITLVLDKVVRLTDGDMFYGRLTWAENAPFAVTNAHTLPMSSEERAFKLTDAKGQLIPEMDVPVDSSVWNPSMLGSSVLPLQFKTDAPIQTPGPVTLTIDHLTVSMSTFGSEPIVFDAGPDPQVGQQWPIDRTFKVLGRTIKMLSATRVADGYDFAFEADSADVQSISVFMPDSAPQHTAEQSHQGKLFHDHVMLMLDDVVYGPIPSGKITIRSLEIIVELSGPWQVTWQP